VEELEQLWSDSFVFGLARSPHTRAVSAYRFLANKIKVAPECDDEAKKVRLWGCIGPGRAAYACCSCDMLVAAPPAAALPAREMQGNLHLPECPPA